MDGVNFTEIIMEAVGGNVDIEATDRHLEQAIQERMRTWQQIQSRFLTPLRDFDLESIQAVIDHSDDITVSNQDIEEFISTYFAAFDGNIENTRYKNFYRLTTPRLLASYPGVRSTYDRVTFHKWIVTVSL